MEADQQDLREKRMQAVAKLKRAASLPRMKDGRRPPMHPEGVSDSEKVRAQDAQLQLEDDAPQELPREDDGEQVAEEERYQEAGEEGDDEDKPELELDHTPDADIKPEIEPAVPVQDVQLTTRSAKRRSRSRSRSRGSKDFKGKARAAQSPTPTLQLNGGDSSLDEGPPPPLFDVPSPLPSPIPAHLLDMQRLRMHRSPTPTTQEQPPSPFNGNMFLRNPTLPTLEALQKGLMRSNSAGSRAMAMHKLTGGTEMYDPTPMAGLSRNNTVTGGERLAARNNMFNLIGGRITKETDNDQASGSDERPTPSPTPKRRRRRSRRGSLSAQANTTAASEGDIDSSSPPPPPSIPPTPTPPALPTVPPIRSISRPTTPHLGEVRSWEQMPSSPDPRPSETIQSYELAGGMRRRSVLVEDDDDDNVPASPPSQPAVAGPTYNVQMRNSPQPPRQIETWNRSPYPHQQSNYLQEVPTTDDDEEEQVLFGADTHRSRTPFLDTFDREISWVADPVPELGIRIPINEKDTDEEPIYEEQSMSSPPLSPDSFSAPEGEGGGFGSPSHRSVGSKSLLVESETSPMGSPSNLPPSPSGPTVAQLVAPPLASADSSSSITQPIISSPSVLSGSADAEERAAAETGSKRNGELSTWEKVKNTFRGGNGRRSRTNSIAARRDQRESSVSHESGASHISSSKVDKADMSSTPTPTPQPSGAPIIMQAPSTSGSMLSVGPLPPRGGPSPIPPPSSADMSKYQNAKLFPFPGIKKLEEEQRNRRVGPSTSTPDILSVSRSNDEENPSGSSVSSPTTPLQGLVDSGRERKLSRKNSDSQLAKTSNSFRDHIPFLSKQPSIQATETGGLPKTLADVRQYMMTRDGSRGKGTSRPGSPGKPPLALPGKTYDLDTDWEEVGLTPISPSNSLDPRQTNDGKTREGTDTEKTPKAKKLYRDINSSTTSNSPSPPSVPSSRPDLLSSATPDPSSSLSDFPAHSTSESSSTSSSQFSANAGLQGPALLEKFAEDLSRGSLSRLSSSIDEDQRRKLVLSSAVFQVVNPNTLKDRFLFLFTDILVIAKPLDSDVHDSYRANPLDRRFAVKSIVQLSQLRWNAERTDTVYDPATYSPLQNPNIKSFVTNFSRDPESAVHVLQSKSGLDDDPIAVGQLLFKTLELDRFRLGEYLAKRSNKGALKTYLDCFRFEGMRIDDALRIFLLSINVPSGLSSHNNGLQYLLDAFAGRWYEANAQLVDFDKDCAHLLARAITQLNELLNNNSHSRDSVPFTAFAGAFRRYESRTAVSDKMLEDIYQSIANEKLFQACSLTGPTVSITVKRPIPPRLTWKVQSEPIILRLPHADPDLRIKLDGQGLEFDPPVLSFTRSPEASFRVKGLTLGPKSILFRRMGSNADRYTGLPLSSPINVERAFMRHTFQIAFKNHHGIKRHYMFSVEDSLLRHQWVSSLKQHASSNTQYGSGTHNKLRRGIELMAFKALQDVLIASRSINVISKAIQRLDDSAQQNGHHKGDSHQSESSFHTRSKSRSKFYHQHGVGKHEATFLSGDGLDFSDRGESESESRNLGPTWCARDIELHCRHNGSVANVVMNFLERERDSNVS